MTFRNAVISILGSLCFAPVAGAASIYTVTELAALAGFGSSTPTGINDNGQVVGYSTSSISGTGSGDTQAVLWLAGSTAPIELGILGGSYTTATGINNNGQVVGSAYTSGGYYHAVLWQSPYGVPTDLGTLGGNSSKAAGISNSGQVVGEADSGNGTPHPALWQAGATTATDLDTAEKAVACDWHGSQQAGESPAITL